MNKGVRLEKFREKDNKRIGIIVFTIVCILLVSGVILYRTFAIFEVNNNFNVINGSVEDPGDIYFAFYKDEQIQKEMPKKEEGYVLDESQSYCGVTGGNDSNIKVFVTEDNMIHVSGVTTSRTKCNLYFVRGVYILGKGIPLVESGEGLYEVKHDDVTEINEGFKTTEYRYAGKDPNNYIKFNDEEWRIIGLVNVMTDEYTVEQRVKIIRKDSIGSYSWDTSGDGINDYWGINEWSESDLMKLLNSGYDTNKDKICTYNADTKISTCENENGLVNNSLYWNGESGTCYNGASQRTITCNFQENNKMPDILKDMLDIVTWNTGSNGNKYLLENIQVNEFYKLERSNQTGKICDNSKSGCNDIVARKTSWQGKVGLIYSSDYGWATSGGNLGRNKCIETEMNSWNSYENCYNNDWLYTENQYWTLSPFAMDEYAGSAFNIGDDGKVDKNGVGNGFNVYPTLYLKTNVKILNDDTNGSITEPYNLGQLLKYK